jgi:2-aminobenzoate-CoA ligase
VPSAHRDSFARDHLPPRELWPEMDFGALPELRTYGNRLNAAVELLDRALDLGRGDRPAIHFDGHVWSYRRLKEQADRIARVLVEDMGLVPGNRVMLRAPNNPALVACWFAVLKAGGIAVTTMPLLRARELTFMLDRARIRHALCDVRLADEMEAARKAAEHPVQLAYFTSESNGSSGDADLDRRAAAKPAGFVNCDTAADDPALIAFTSGTTGRPKGTMHFHRDVLAITDCFPRHIFDATADDIFCGSPPLAFTFGLGALTLFPMRFGAAAVLLEKPSPEALLETVQRYRATAIYTAPTAYRAMADLTRRFDLKSLRKSVSAGEHLPKPTSEAWQRASGIRIIDGLGATEMLHIFVSAAGVDIRPGATGKAIPGYQACVVDDEVNPLAPGSIGRLAVRGPTGCRYIDDLERQKLYVQRGWNLTGDIYEMDRDGYFWYQARADDMIITAGYNIAGPEVEAILLDHPKVKECAVIGAPDPQRGQIVKAFVVLREAGDAGADTVKLLQDYVKAEIAPYKYPRAIEFVAALPRTETGKLQRFRLRDQEMAKPGKPA